MREYAFSAHLAPLLGGSRSVGSYRSNARLVEKTLGIDLDRLDLSEPGIAAVRDRLVEHGVRAKKAGDCVSALRRYAELGRPAA